MQVYCFPEAMAVAFSFGHSSPFLTAADEGRDETSDAFDASEDSVLFSDEESPLLQLVNTRLMAITKAPIFDFIKTFRLSSARWK